MTLSPKQIISDRELCERKYYGTSFRESVFDERVERLEALEDFFLSMQPRPIEEAPKEDSVPMNLWCEEHGWVIGYWRERRGVWIEDGPDHDIDAVYFLPSSSLPLPEGQS